jgi:hypothetical protein
VCAYYHYEKKPVDVWVMAESEKEANRLAEQYAGIYFDGIRKGLDCRSVNH